MSIPFTQYLLPNGRKRPITIERPAAIEAQAQALLGRGCVFEVEVLRTGEISLEALGPESDGDRETLSVEIVENGPEVPDAVDRLVVTAATTFAGGQPS